SAALQQLFTDAGFPQGCYVNVHATGEQIGRAIADPRVQGVSFTGSERAGAEVAAKAGRSLKKVVLELGGSDPFIVLSTDDLDATVRAAVETRFENAGQACNAGKRFIVAEDLYDAFLDRFTEKVLTLTGAVAPLSSVAAAEYVEEQVGRAVKGGATF
ncbi:aldehyde dehydrogenase family protein, partial [Streptomyces sp. SID7760]|nr:aldehyde dehydrogenase family protein [Streptomyces sp. SID7760]